MFCFSDGACGMRTTVLYAVHNNYMIFRASIESLLAHVPSSHYAKLLIVDDCSSDKALLGFLDRLSDNFDFVEVIHTGDPADLSYYNTAGRGRRRICTKGDNLRGDRQRGDRRSLGNRKISQGHGESVNMGLARVETKFVLIVDSDNLFMEKSHDMIPGMEACMDMDPAIMNVGALVNRIDGRKVFDKLFNIRDLGDDMAVSDRVASRGGWPAFIGGLSRMSGWRKHELPPMNNGGWISGDYGPALFAHGFKTCNFNVFRDGYLIHLGYATLRKTRDGGSDEACKGFFFSRDKVTVTGDRGWWYGHHRVPYTTAEFEQILRGAYAELDFSTRKNIVTFEGEV